MLSYARLYLCEKTICVCVFACLIAVCVYDNFAWPLRMNGCASCPHACHCHLFQWQHCYQQLLQQLWQFIRNCDWFFEFQQHVLKRWCWNTDTLGLKRFCFWDCESFSQILCFKSIDIWLLGMSFSEEFVFDKWVGNICNAFVVAAWSVFYHSVPGNAVYIMQHVLIKTLSAHFHWTARD